MKGNIENDYFLRKDISEFLQPLANLKITDFFLMD